MSECEHIWVVQEYYEVHECMDCKTKRLLKVEKQPHSQKRKYKVIKSGVVEVKRE